ncbi:MAG: signal peptide peptidase SppA [archaeon]
MNKKAKAWVFVLIVIIILFFFSMLIAGIISVLFGGDVSAISGNVAVIPIKGTIVTEGSPGIFSQDLTSSSKVVGLIERADKNVNIKAIVFEINSGGGSAVASDEIASKIKKIEKPTVSWIREVGASGAYWIASSTDYIIVNRMSITGSIGVIGSYLQFSGLMSRYNVTYERLVGGKYKDIGTPFKSLEDKERELFQKEIDIIHDYFIDEVSQNRNIPRDKIEEIATGLFYTGVQAKELGLVDELGGEDEVKQYLEKKYNISVNYVRYEDKPTFLEMLSQALILPSFYMGKGIGSAFLDREVTNTLEVWA